MLTYNKNSQSLTSFYPRLSFDLSSSNFSPCFVSFQFISSSHWRPSIARTVAGGRRGGRSAAGGRSRVRAPLDWRGSARSGFGPAVGRRPRKSAQVVGDDVPCSFRVSSGHKAFVRRASVVTLGRPRLASIACLADSLVSPSM